MLVDAVPNLTADMVCTTLLRKWGKNPLFSDRQWLCDRKASKKTDFMLNAGYYCSQRGLSFHAICGSYIGTLISPKHEHTSVAPFLGTLVPLAPL